MNISYSLLSKNDIDGVLNVNNISFSNAWSKDSIISEFNNPLAKYIVAKDLDKDMIVGFVGIWIIQGEGDITNIAVHPNYRKLGIAKKLLSFLLALCDNLSCTIIHLEVRKSNISAQSLYKQFLFVEDGFRPNYYTNPKDDAVLMTYKK